MKHSPMGCTQFKLCLDMGSSKRRQLRSPNNVTMHGVLAQAFNISNAMYLLALNSVRTSSSCNQPCSAS